MFKKETKVSTGMETRAEIISVCTITAVTDNAHAGSGGLVSLWQGQERSLQHVLLDTPLRGELPSVRPAVRPALPFGVLL